MKQTEFLDVWTLMLLLCPVQCIEFTSFPLVSHTETVFCRNVTTVRGGWRRRRAAVCSALMAAAPPRTTLPVPRLRVFLCTRMTGLSSSMSPAAVTKALSIQRYKIRGAVPVFSLSNQSCTNRAAVSFHCPVRGENSSSINYVFTARD